MKNEIPSQGVPAVAGGGELQTGDLGEEISLGANETGPFEGNSWAEGINPASLSRNSEVGTDDARHPNEWQLLGTVLKRVIARLEETRR